MTMDRVYELETEVERLRAEIAELREGQAHLTVAAREWRERNEKLRSEYEERVSLWSPVVDAARAWVEVALLLPPEFPLRDDELVLFDAVRALDGRTGLEIINRGYNDTGENE